MAEEKVIALRLEIDGVNVTIANQRELRDEIDKTRKLLKDPDLKGAAYDQQSKRLSTLQQIQRNVTKENKAFATQLQATGKLGAGAYDKLNAELAVLRTRIKDIQASGGIVPKADLTRLQQLDTQLKNIDRSVGQNFRNVGNYRQALLSVGDVVTGGLLTGGIAGIAVGAQRVLSDAIQTVKEFETELAKLASITGLEGDALDDLSQKAIDLSGNFGTSATDIVRGFGLVGSAIPELLQSGDALAEITKQADILSKASGLTLDQAIGALTKSLNQYGLGAESAAMVTDVLATSQQRGTARIDAISESLKNVGSVAAATGLDIEQTNVLLQALAKGGLEGAEAGTKLRTILLRLSKTGREDLNPALTSFEDILETLSGEVTTVTQAQELFGEEAAAAALTLIKQKQVVEDLNGALNDSGNALSQANINTNTLEGANQKLSASYDALVLSLNKGSENASGFLKKLSNDTQSIVDAFRLYNDGAITSFNEFLKATSGPLENRLRFIENIEERQRKLNQTPTTGRRLGGGGGDTTSEFNIAKSALAAQREAIKGLTKDTDEYNIALQDLEFYQKRFTEAEKAYNEENKKTGEQVQSTSTKTKEAATAAAGSIKFLKDEVAKIKSELENAPPNKVEEQLIKLGEAEKDLEKAEQAVRKLKRTLEGGEATSVDQIATLDLLPTDGLESTAKDSTEILAEKSLEIAKENILKQEQFRLEQEEQTNEQILQKRKELQDQITSFIESAAGKLLQIQSDRVDREEKSELDSINRKYDQEIKLAEGNETRIERLNQERDQAIQQTEREAAQRRKDIALTEAKIALALEIVKSLSNPLQLAATIALGTIQIALIEAQEFAYGGQVQSISGERVTDSNINPTSKGDNVLAYVRTGEVVLNQQQQARLKSLTNEQIFGMIGVPGFSSNGITNMDFSPPAGIIHSLMKNSPQFIELKNDSQKRESNNRSLEATLSKAISDGFSKAHTELNRINERLNGVKR